MKRATITLSLTLLFTISAITAWSQARVQIIHNSADMAAAEVDIWVNDVLTLDNFAFRSATPFIDLPANTPLNVAVQPANSTSAENPLWSQSYTLSDNSTYQLIANGIVSATGYTPATPFNIAVYDQARESSSTTTSTDVLVFHGSTDAPTVDVFETGVGAGKVVNNLTYASFAGYLELPSNDYNLQVRDATGLVTVAQYGAPLQTLKLEGTALTVLASGFLNPASNSNGAPFGLYVALPSGGPLVELPSQTIDMPRVQVIHNSADAAAQMVDIWLNDQKLLDDFSFRNASPFVEAQSFIDFDVTIQPANSTDTTNALARYTYNLEAMSDYIIIANGIISATGYDPAEPFNLHVMTSARQSAMTSGNTDVLVFHGATDAPTVDIVETGAGAGTIVNDLAYADFAGYLELTTADYNLQVRDATGSITVAQYSAPLQTLKLEGMALTVLASGFLDPTNNSNGVPFGLYVALPSGGPLVELPSQTIDMPRVQVIHNSADAAAQMVDIWLNDQKLLDDFSFRNASPFVEAQSFIDFDVTIQPANSTDTTNALARYTYNLEAMSDYIIIANGIISATGYDPAEPFNLHVMSSARQSAMTSGNTDVLVFHGATDAPTVDIVETGAGAGTIVNDLAYGTFSNYLELPTADYTLDIRDETGVNTVATYHAPLASLGLDDAAITVLASGFLNPANNNNGEPFGLYVALTSGGELIPLPNITGINESILSDAEFNLYPNPVRDILNITWSDIARDDIKINITDITGKTIITRENIAADALQQKINIENLPTGLYLLNIQSSDELLTKKFFINR